MSVRVTIDVSGEDRIEATLDALELSLLGVGEDLADKIAEWIWIQTKNRINEMGLYDTGELYNSVQRSGEGDFIVSVEAPYAAALERGSRPSIGRYVPDIDRRLVSPTRRVKAWGKENVDIEIPQFLGEHPGNRAYGFFAQAIEDVTNATDEEWLKRNARWPE